MEGKRISLAECVAVLVATVFLIVIVVAVAVVAYKLRDYTFIRSPW
jgi:hypothetical protein